MLLTAAIMIMAGFSTRIFAQNTATTNAGAKIVSALTLTENTALHFGTMAIPTATSTVSVTTGGSRTSTGTITLLAQAPTFTNAAYTVNGSIGSTYSITVPANEVVTISNGTVTMEVNDFQALAASSAVSPNLGAGGSDTFVVGATLELANGQAAGVYTGTFNVAVNYN